MSSLDVGLDGEICTLDAVGGLLETTTVSVILTDVVVQASPLVPPPLAVNPAIPAVTVPLPETGAVQSKTPCSICFVRVRYGLTTDFDTRITTC